MTENIVDPGNEHCPSDEMFLDYLLTRKSGREREILINHLRFCTDCRTKARILMDVDSSLKQNARRLRPLAKASFREIRAYSRSSRTRTAASWFRRFALIGAGAVLSVFLLTGTMRDSGYLRGAERTIGGLSLPNGSISTAPRLFAWNHVPGGEYYQFELIDDHLRVLVSEGTNRAWVLISESVQKMLRPNGTYIWTVEAFDGGANKIGEFRKYIDFR